MNLKNFGLTGLFATALILGAQSIAFASSVSVSYYTITSSNPDIGRGDGVGSIKSTLGPDGLPVQSAPGNFSNVDAAGQLQWWTPSATVIAGTTYSYPSLATLPFDIQSNFYPNGPGGSNGGAVGYTSAVLSGTFDTPLGGSVTFTLGSDDDAWIFINGKLVVDNAGIHGFSNAPKTIAGLDPGTNTLLVFFADRQTVQSGLYFDADVTINAAVPEASTWAMMILGFFGVGFMAYRRKSHAAVRLA